MSSILQFLYLLAFGAGVVAGMWQTAHPALTLGVLGAVLPLGLIGRLPEHWLPRFVRVGGQGLLTLFSVGWLVWRFQRIGLDMLLIEWVAILALVLVVGAHQRDYGLLALIALVQVAYGGLSPARAAFQPALMLYGVTALACLYGTRTLRLCDGRPVAPARRPALFSRLVWSFVVLHGAAVAATALLLLTLLPAPRSRAVGIIPVSFQPTRHRDLPTSWRDWLGMSALPAEGGVQEFPLQDPGQVDGIDSVAPRLVRLEEDTGVDARVGGGQAPPGRDLVMRVQSPLRLYWLARLFDTYDGGTWSASARLRADRDPLDAATLKGARPVRQNFVIEKMVTDRLVGAFRVLEYRWPLVGSATTADRLAFGWTPDEVRFRPGGFGGARVANRPPLPWRYQCSSMVPGVEAQGALAADAPAPGPVSSPHCELPVDLISPRLRELATRLTRGTKTALDAATALRDHLRKRCRYDLGAAAVPPGAEAVDHFLFVSQEGYCQHFAGALTVLARLAGLPARLATGYSPGHYNVISDTFEVHEYHAHAWTQIHIQPYGWLTFDASPPGALDLAAKPRVLGAMLDPFKDEQLGPPPELQARVSEGGAANVSPGRRLSRPLIRFYVGIWHDAYRASQNRDPGLGALMRSAGHALSTVIRENMRSFWAWLTARCSQLWQFLCGTARRLLGIAVGLGPRAHLILVAAALLAIVAARERAFLHDVYLHWRAGHRCHRLWERLQAAQTRDPALTVAMCHTVCRELLQWARYRRPVRLDLTEYAEWLLNVDPTVGKQIRVVNMAYARCLFGSGPITRADADISVHAAAALREVLRARHSLQPLN